MVAIEQLWDHQIQVGAAWVGMVASGAYAVEASLKQTATQGNYGYNPEGDGSSEDNSNSGGPVSASTLQISAESTQRLFGSLSKTTLPGGFNSCTNCDSISLSPVPPGTGNLDVKLTLPMVGQRANLLLRSFDEL